MRGGRDKDRGSRRRRAGFTLPEVLITLLLISILFTLGIIFMAGLRGTKKMRNYEIAITLAQQAIEVLRAAPFQTIDDADAGRDSVESDLNSQNGSSDLLEPTHQAGSIKYDRKVEVTDIPPMEKDGTPPGLKHVKVSVSWTPPDEEKITYELTSTIADTN